MMEFYFNPADDNLSSLYKDNYGKGKTIPIIVKSIDFGQWLKKNYTKDCHIVVSFDIEGSEYEVLKKMVEDGTIEYIDSLYSEFHPGVGEVSEQDIKSLLEKIRKFGVIAERVEM